VDITSENEGENLPLSEDPPQTKDLDVQGSAETPIDLVSGAPSPRTSRDRNLVERRRVFKMKYAEYLDNVVSSW